MASHEVRPICFILSDHDKTKWDGRRNERGCAPCFVQRESRAGHSIASGSDPPSTPAGQNGEHSLSRFFFHLSSMREVNDVSSAWLPGEFTIQLGLPCRQTHVQYIRFCSRNTTECA